ncbi:MAG: hypothetical protein AVDCRST_MAG33-1798, partial [uncultured Thermomicrobiales bacterium]
ERAADSPVGGVHGGDVDHPAGVLRDGLQPEHVPRPGRRDVPDAGDGVIRGSLPARRRRDLQRRRRGQPHRLLHRRHPPVPAWREPRQGRLGRELAGRSSHRRRVDGATGPAPYRLRRPPGGRRRTCQLGPPPGDHGRDRDGGPLCLPPRRDPADARRDQGL